MSNGFVNGVFESDESTSTTAKATTFDTNVAAAAVTLAGTSLVADGTDTDINLNLKAKGDGYIQSRRSDGSAAAYSATDLNPIGMRLYNEIGHTNTVSSLLLRSQTNTNGAFGVQLMSVGTIAYTGKFHLNIQTGGSTYLECITIHEDGEVNIPKVDINSGAIDGVTIATSDITVGAGKTLDVSAGTLTLADNQISGDKVEGGTIAATTITELTSTTAKATTFDTNVAAAGVTISGTSLTADGTDTNIDIPITPKGTGVVLVEKLGFDADTTAIKIASTGEVTMPNQSSFLVLSTGETDFTGYSGSDIGFDTVVFDRNNDYTDALTYTAPVTGVIQFNLNITFLLLREDTYDSGYLKISTSNREYDHYIGHAYDNSDVGGTLSANLSVLADMDAADTAKCVVGIGGGGTGVGIGIGSSNWSGHLAC